MSKRPITTIGKMRHHGTMQRKTSIPDGSHGFGDTWVDFKSLKFAKSERNDVTSATDAGGQITKHIISVKFRRIEDMVTSALADWRLTYPSEQKVYYFDTLIPGRRYIVATINGNRIEAYNG